MPEKNVLPTENVLEESGLPEGNDLADKELNVVNEITVSKSQGTVLLFLNVFQFIFICVFYLEPFNAEKITSVNNAGKEQPDCVKTDAEEVHLNDETTNSDPEVEQLMKLPDTVSQLTSKDGVKVYLVGTAHFSLESQEDVAKVKR
jgi:hypothetical protein